MTKFTKRNHTTHSHFNGNSKCFSEIKIISVLDRPRRRSVSVNADPGRFHQKKMAMDRDRRLKAKVFCSLSRDRTGYARCSLSGFFYYLNLILSPIFLLYSVSHMVIKSSISFGHKLVLCAHANFALNFPLVIEHVLTKKVKMNKP